MSSEYIDKLYSYGYILTDYKDVKQSSIGIDWTKWNHFVVGSFDLFVHSSETAYVYERYGMYYVLVGHAYNPVTLEDSEGRILQTLAQYSWNSEEYRNYFDQLTGLFVFFIISAKKIIAACDCAGMMGAYYGLINGKIFFSAHAQMIADLIKLKEDEYVTDLKKSKTFHLYGLYLPSDFSPYAEIKRILPNVEVLIKNNNVKLHRFYPRKAYYVDPNYEGIVQQVGNLLHNNLLLISKKWKRPAISLTGGTDSKTTLACAADLQDSFLYFSYISLPREATDAYAARDICEALGLNHEIFMIDTNPDNKKDFKEVDELIERQYGYLGKANINDVCKRIDLDKQFHFDIEVKSWVSEVARASRYTKYNKDRLPKDMTPRILTSIYKIFTYDRWNAIRTDEVFRQYLEKTKLSKVIKETNYPWSEFFVWENVFGGWGGLTLSCEHKYSNNITIPYNNRFIIDLMLRTPLEKRKSDQLHRDIADYMDPRINKLGIHVVNGNETKKREIIEGLYFDIHSRLPL